MRYVFPLLMLFALLLHGQALQHEPACVDVGRGPVMYWYYRAVMEEIRPPDRSLISMSITVSGMEWKLVLRTQGGNNFELLRGTPEEDVFQLLSRLNDSCRLPPDPDAAVKLVKFNWQIAPLSAGKFAELHRGFTHALTQTASNMQSRYNSLVTTGLTFQNLHVAQYSVVYDNKFEHLEVTAADTTDDIARMDSLVKWVRGVLELSGNASHRK